MDLPYVVATVLGAIDHPPPDFLREHRIDTDDLGSFDGHRRTLLASSFGSDGKRVRCSFEHDGMGYGVVVGVGEETRTMV